MGKSTERKDRTHAPNQTTPQVNLLERDSAEQTMNEKVGERTTVLADSTMSAVNQKTFRF